MTMTMEIICPSTGGHEAAVISWHGSASAAYSINVLDAVTGPETGFLSKLQEGYRESKADILCYLHSDTFIHESWWDQRVLREFEDPTVGIVGFGGGKSLGSPDIYKIGYHYQQLARYDFVSNLRDAEKHGRRNRNEEDIAVVDSFSLVVRRSLLDHCGGWPISTYPSMHCSDTWACLVARRMGLRVRMVGISCTHTSGGVKGDNTFDYGAWQKEIGETDSEQHRRGHRLLYDEFRPELPIVTR